MFIWVLAALTTISLQFPQRRALYYSKTENICRSEMKDDVGIDIYGDGIWKLGLKTFGQSYCMSDEDAEDAIRVADSWIFYENEKDQSKMTKLTFVQKMHTVYYLNLLKMLYVSTELVNPSMIDGRPADCELYGRE